MTIKRNENSLLCYNLKKLDSCESVTLAYSLPVGGFVRKRRLLESLLELCVFFNPL
jgi:hypothetical protein